MGFIFFLLSLTPLVPCGLHTQFCCICSFFDYQEESSIYCAKLPWSKTNFGFFHTDLLWLCPQCPLIKGSLVIQDLMRLNLKVENRAKKEHNVSSSVGRPDKLSTFITFLCGAGHEWMQSRLWLFFLALYYETHCNTYQCNSCCKVSFMKWCVRLNISVVQSRSLIKILLVGLRWNISKPPSGPCLLGRFLVIMNYHICRTIGFFVLKANWNENCNDNRRKWKQRVQ